MIFLHVYAYFLHNLEQGIGFTQQKKAKGKLVEYIIISSLVCPCPSVFHSRRSQFHSSWQGEVV